MVSEGKLMDRRQFLIGSGTVGLTALAGCSSGDTEGGDTGGSGSDTGSTSEPTPQPGPDIVTGEATLKEDTNSPEWDTYKTGKYVSVDVENQGGGASGWIELKVEWYDADGNFLDNSENGIVTLGPGEIWKARVYPPSNLEDISGYKLSGSFKTAPPQAPEGVKLVESKLHSGEVDLVTGRVKNDTGGELRSLGAIAKVYDSEGAVLYASGTNQSEIPKGATWKFSIRFFQFYRQNKATDHTVLFDSGY